MLLNFIKDYITKYICLYAVDDSLNQRAAAKLYDEDKSYIAGEFVTYGGYLYKATKATGMKPFDIADFEETTLIESGGGSGGAVQSVNGKTGHVILNPDDVNTYSKSAIDSALAGKAATGSSYSKAEEDGLLASKRNLSDSYSKSEVDAAVNSRIVKPVATGTAGQVLTLASDGISTEWKDASGTSAVTSVNGKVGAVVLSAADVGAYNTTQTDTLLGAKADTSSVYNKTQIDSALANKANVGASYTKSEEDTLLAAKMNTADAYTKTQTDTLLGGKEDLGYSYSKAESNALLDTKANAGDMTSALALKANVADVYDKAATDTLLSHKVAEPTTAGSAGQVLSIDTDGTTRVWKTISPGSAGVESINGKTGIVTLNANEVPMSDASGSIEAAVLTKAKSTSIAEEFLTSKAYTKNNLVMHNNRLYKAKTDMAAGAWDASKWETTAIANELGSADLTCVAPEYSETTEYYANDIVLHNNKVYYCAKKSATGPWNPSEWVECPISKLLIYDAIAPIWNADAIYHKGYWVVYRGHLYSCAVDDSTMGEFKSDEWSQISIDQTLNTMTQTIINYTAPWFSEYDNYEKNAYVMHLMDPSDLASMRLYKAKYNILAGPWDDAKWEETTLIAMRDDLSYQKSITRNVWSADVQYALNDVVMMKGKLCKAIVAAPTKGAFLNDEWDFTDVFTELASAGSVQSVQGKTGDVIVYGEEIKTDTSSGALTIKAALDAKVSEPNNTPSAGMVLGIDTDGTTRKWITVSGASVSSVNGMTGSVVVDSNDIKINKSDASSITVKQGLTALESAVGNTYTKTATDNLLSAKADKDTTYTKSEVDTELAKKVNNPDASVAAGKVLKSTASGTSWENESITDVNGKSGSVTLYGSDIKVHTGAGSTTIKETIDLIDITLQNTYLKSETYSKSDVNSLLSNKADKTDTYTKSETYTKTETNTELTKKIDKPATTVATGSIPVSNGAGNVTWRAESVLSVNGNTGTVNITAADVNAVKTPDTPGTAGQFLALDTDGNTVIWKSSSSSIDSVNGKTGVVVLSGEDIKVNTVSATDVGTAITTLETNVANKADASDTYTKTEVDTKDATKITKPTTAGTAAQILRIKDAATQEVEWADPSSATAPVTSVNSKLGDVILYGDEIAIDNSVGAATIKETTTALQTSVNNKYNKSETYSKSETNSLLANKADSSDVYTMTEVDTLLSGKVDTGTVYLKSETYSQAEVTTLMAAKANTSDVYNKTQVYTKTEVDAALTNKASVGDSYTKAEENSLLDAKANASDVYSKTDIYTKTEVDTAMSAKANTADVYNKSVLYTKTETDTELGKKIDKPATTVVSGYIPKSNGTGDVTWASETITSVNTKTGAVVLSAADVGAAAETHTHSASDITSGNIAADRITSVNLDALTATTTCPTIPLSLLPSFVSAVVEVNTYSELPATGESNKIYITKDTNKSYRWGGTSYVELATGVALGETELTAYRGDRGKIAYEHSLTEGSLGSAIAQGMYKVGFSATGHITSYDTVAKSDLDAIVGDNIGKVNGVSVNGTAITLDSSFVANIPAATSSAFGVVKVDGTSISSTSGLISVVEASSANISARNSTAVIDTKNYDAAVKQALVDNANSSVVYSAADELAARTLINSAGRQDIAATYSATSTYSAGDLAYHDGVLYKAKAAITTAEPWTPEHWDTTTIAASMGSAGAGMPIYEAYDGAKSYSVGARVSYESKYYMAKVNTVGILPTVSANWIEVVPETELANQLTALAVALGASLSVVWDSTNNKFTYTYNI